MHVHNIRSVFDTIERQPLYSSQELILTFHKLSCPPICFTLQCLLQTRLSHQQETVSMQPPLVETGHIFTQTSSKDYSAGSTQTSTRQLPHRTTQTSQRVSPDIGVQTSLVAQPVHVGVVQKSSLKRSWHESSNDRSSTEFVSPSSYHNNNDSAVTTGLQRQNTVLKKHVREQMLVQEKDTLKEHMQMDCNIGKTFTKYDGVTIKLCATIIPGIPLSCLHWVKNIKHL